MEMIFHSLASKTRFHKKGCALGLILKVRVLKVAYKILGFHVTHTKCKVAYH